MINFNKMHGLGNDFVFLREQDFHKLNLTPKFIADRKIGVGCDQLILYELDRETNIIDMKIFNHDGSEASMCVNAMRCLAYLCYSETKHKDYLINVNNFKVIAKVINKENVEIIFSKTTIKNITLDNDDDILIRELLTRINPNATYHSVNIGNNHIIFFLPSQFDFSKLNDIDFSEFSIINNYNINFASLNQKNEIDLRVYERGVGFTLACGSGACVTAYASQLLNITEGGIFKINFLLGSLIIVINNETLTVKGPVERSFIGQFKEI